MSVPFQDEKELYRAREYEINMRHWAASDNVLQILTKYQGTGEDEQLLKVKCRSRNMYIWMA